MQLNFVPVFMSFLTCRQNINVMVTILKTTQSFKALLTNHSIWISFIIWFAFLRLFQKLQNSLSKAADANLVMQCFLLKAFYFLQNK